MENKIDRGSTKKTEEDSKVPRQMNVQRRSTYKETSEVDRRNDGEVLTDGCR